MGFEYVFLHEVEELSNREETFKKMYPDTKGFESDLYIECDEPNKINRPFEVPINYNSGDLFGLHVFQTKEIKLCKVVSCTECSLIFKEI